MNGGRSGVYHDVVTEPPTTLAPAQCSNCGARVARSDAVFCPFCGHQLPRTVPDHQPPSASRAERFRRLQELPDYATWLSTQPPTGALVRSGGMQIAGGVFLLALIAGMTLFFWSILPIMAIVPAIMFVVVLVRLLGTTSRVSAVASGEMQARPALIVEKHEEAQDRKHSQAPRWWITLEAPDATREQLEVPVEQARLLAAGDIGVALTSAGYLVGFQRADL
jgi:hypothetical protein